jgi:hypothetical protein
MSKAEKAKEYEATMPDGRKAEKKSSRPLTHALCVPQIGKSGLWCVLRWGANEKLLSREAKLRMVHTHGERTAVVVPVTPASGPKS